jgi:hypothetical protein
VLAFLYVWFFTVNAKFNIFLMHPWNLYFYLLSWFGCKILILFINFTVLVFFTQGSSMLFSFFLMIGSSVEFLIQQSGDRNLSLQHDCSNLVSFQHTSNWISFMVQQFFNFCEKPIYKKVEVIPKIFYWEENFKCSSWTIQ